jgi:hypothetical protein
MAESGLPFWKRLGQPETAIFLVLWLLLMVGGRDKLFRDPGTFWHTRLGLIMLEEHHLIHGDSFSFTVGPTPAGHDWLPHQWLGEWLMGVLYRIGGWDVLHLAAATILAGLYAWIARRLICCGLHWVLAALIMFLTLAAGSSHFHTRPHLATMVFFGTTFAFLADFEAGRKSLAHLFWLVPIYALWSNLHGGMLGGLVTMGLAVAGWTVWRLFGADSPVKSVRDFVALSLLIVACGLTAFANPYGARLPGVWLNIMGQKRLTELIQEHAPLDPTKGDAWVVLALAAVYVAVLLATLPRRWPAVTWLLPIIWLYLAWTRIRHASLFGIAAGLAIAEMFPYTTWAESIVKKGSDLFDAARGKAAQATGWVPFLLPALVVLGALVLKAEAIQVPIMGAGWADYRSEICPLGLEKHLEKYPDGTPIFNELNFGGYLIFFTPNMRVFVDDRCELHGEDFLLEYDKAQRNREEAARFLAPYRFDLALTRSGSGFDAYFRQPDSGWEEVETIENATLFCRRSISDAANR